MARNLGRVAVKPVPQRGRVVERTPPRVARGTRRTPGVEPSSAAKPPAQQLMSLGASALIHRLHAVVTQACQPHCADPIWRADRVREIQYAVHSLGALIGCTVTLKLADDRFHCNGAPITTEPAHAPVMEVLQHVWRQLGLGLMVFPKDPERAAVMDLVQRLLAAMQLPDAVHDLLDATAEIPCLPQVACRQHVRTTGVFMPEDELAG